METNKIEHEKIDITDPNRESDKIFMRTHSTPREGQKVPLPPQIFHDMEYCGVSFNECFSKFLGALLACVILNCLYFQDYEGLHAANEFDEVFLFLKMEKEESESRESKVESEVFFRIIFFC